MDTDKIMPNMYGVPEVSVTELADRQVNGDQFVWLDVREPNEQAAVSIDDERIYLLPMSRLASEQLAALPDVAKDQDAEIVVMCHHGIRSAQVVAWLSQQGWTNVINLDGGIAAWASEVDPTVGTY